MACRTLGLILLEEAQPAQAEELFQQSLRMSIETGHRFGTAESLEGLAVAAGSTGKRERAAKLLGAAEAYRDEIGQPLTGEGTDGQVTYRFSG